MSLLLVTIYYLLCLLFQIIDTVKENLHDGIKLAIFDHIPSSTAFVMPLKEIVKLCKER